MDRSQGRTIHPLHAVLLAGTVPLFLGTVLSDCAYSKSYEVQWLNFSSWLIIGGLTFCGLALLWALVDLLRGAQRTGRALGYFLLLLAACSSGSHPDLNQYGANPELPAQERGVLPDMTIAKPAEWGDLLPTVHEGFTIKAIATGLAIPRQTLVLPNGDILVADGRGGSAPKLTPKDVIAMATATTTRASSPRTSTRPTDSR